LHPAIAHALGRFAVDGHVGNVVAETGYSHRRFIGLFHAAVGLTPKRYCRVLRFRRAPAPRPDEPPRVALALAAGLTDQPHFNREFREFTGVSPERYRRVSAAGSHHVPIRP